MLTWQEKAKLERAVADLARLLVEDPDAVRYAIEDLPREKQERLRQLLAERPPI